MCEDYPVMAHYLSEDADILHKKDFERAVFKILYATEAALSQFERTSVCHLCILLENHPAKSTFQKDSTDLSYYEKLVQKRRRLNESVTNFI